MKRLLSSVLLLTAITSAATAQVGVGTTSPASSAALDVTSTTGGFLPPRMTWSQIQAISAPVAGLTVYDIGAKALRLYDGHQWTLIAPRTGGSLSDAPGTYSSVRNTVAPGGHLYISSLRIAQDGTTVLVGSAIGAVTIGGLTATIPSSPFFAKLDANGAALFIKSLPCATAAAVNAVDIDAAGNIYLGGYFSGTMDADPGAGVQALTSAGATDAFLAAYNASGAHLWSKAMGGASGDAVQCVTTDGTSVYAGGNFQGPGNFGTTLTNVGGQDGWVGKYSAATGAFGYATRLGGPDHDVVTGVSIYSGGGIMVAGAFFDNISLGTTMLTSAGDRDGFLASINIYGTVGSAHKIGGSGTDYISALQTDASGNIYLGGTCMSGANFHLSGAAVPQPLAGGHEGFAVKYNAGFNLQYFRPISTSANDNVNRLAIDTAGNAYIGGTSNASVVSVAAGISYNAVGGRDGYLLKLNPAGAPVWIQNTGGTNDAFFYGLDVSKSGKLLYSAVSVAAPPYFTFDKVRVTEGRYYIARYEE